MASTSIETVDKIRDLITSVEELAFNRDTVSIVNDIAHDLADLGKADKNAGTVVVTETALNVVLGIEFLVDMVHVAGQIGKLSYHLFFRIIVHFQQ